MTETTQETVAPALDKLAAALAAFQAEMPTVPKAHTAQVKSDKGSYSYTYAGLADVSEAAMPLLAKHGLSFSCLPGGGALTGMLMHSSGQSLTASLPINGATPQAVGSSLTYMRRYLLGCMTGLVTDDDDDGQLAQQAKKPPARKPAQQPRQPAPGETGEAITPPQVAKMGALMSEIGLKDRDDALKYVADVVGRPVESRNDLSKTEAHKVIESLLNDQDPTRGGSDG